MCIRFLDSQSTVYSVPGLCGAVCSFLGLVEQCGFLESKVFLAFREMCITLVEILILNVNDAIALTIDVDDHKGF